jgi:putative redox protein
MYADRHNWPLEKTSVKVRYKIVVAGDGKSSVDRFERIVRIEGDLTDQQRAHLLEIANRCPVSQTLRRSSVIVTSLAEPSRID